MSRCYDCPKLDKAWADGNGVQQRLVCCSDHTRSVFEYETAQPEPGHKLNRQQRRQMQRDRRRAEMPS